MWEFVSMTYDGQTIALYLMDHSSEEKVLVGSATFAGSRFNLANEEILRIGENFGGDIDEVLMHNTASPMMPNMTLPVMSNMTSPMMSNMTSPMNSILAFCPSLAGNITGNASIVAYFRFNEGVGSLVHDSSTYENHGYVGVVTSMIKVNASRPEISITRCPEGYRIGKVVFADWGDVERTGEYSFMSGNFSTRANAEKFYTAWCTTVKPDGTYNNCEVFTQQFIFGPVNPTGDTFLAALLTCVPLPGTMSPWTSDAGAPTHRGMLSNAAVPICPGDLRKYLPVEVLSPEDSMDFENCTEWSMNDARAGVTKFFALRGIDKCGYVSNVRATGGTFAGELAWDLPTRYAQDFSTCAEPSCSSDATTLTSHGVESWWAGEEEASMGMCTSYKDAYLFWYTPEYVGSALLTLNLTSGHNAPTQYLNTTVIVTPGPISDLSEVGGSAVMAGVSVGHRNTLVIKGIDSANNAVTGSCDESAASFDLAFLPDTVMYEYILGNSVGTCDFAVIYGAPGEYNVTVSFMNVPIFETAVTVSAQSVDSMEVFSMQPGNRTESSMAMCSSEAGDALYLFGGASCKKAFLSDTWRFTPGNMPAFMYRTDVNVTAPMDGHDLPAKFAIELLLDTAFLIDGGLMRPDCIDLMFTTKDGMPLKYWLDPVPGCGCSETVVWVELMSSDDIVMYTGSMTTTPPGKLASPEEIVSWFEDFEYPHGTSVSNFSMTASDTNAGSWSTVAAGDTCVFLYLKIALTCTFCCLDWAHV